MYVLPALPAAEEKDKSRSEAEYYSPVIKDKVMSNSVRLSTVHIRVYIHSLLKGMEAGKFPASDKQYDKHYLSLVTS